MTTITNEYMMEKLKTAKAYTLVILKPGPNPEQPEADKLIWEHARRNFALLEEGMLQIVGPVADGSDVNGIYIFDATDDQVREILDADPGVQLGFFAYETHPMKSFPGTSLK